MYYKVCLYFTFLLSNVYSVSINPKLNFEDVEPSSTHISNPSNVQSDVIAPKGDAKASELLQNISVQCDSVGCNTTKNATNNENDISANILVHIKTNNNNNHQYINRSQATSEEVPDVPVVLGYGGISESEKAEIDQQKHEVFTDDEIHSHRETFDPSVVSVVAGPPVFAGQRRRFDDIRFKEGVVGLQPPSYDGPNRRYYGEPLEPGLFYPQTQSGEAYKSGEGSWSRGIAVGNYQKDGVPAGWHTCLCRDDDSSRLRTQHVKPWYTGPLPMVGLGNQNPGTEINGKVSTLDN